MKSKTEQKHIYLIGFSGSGKSTLGPKLASKLGYKYLDLDDMIESSTMQNISQIFAEKGERHFRKLESALIATIAKRSMPHVVALGGGAFENAGTRRLLLGTGIVVYLSCSIKELVQRMINHDDRPMLKEKRDPTHQTLKKRITELLTKRKPNYMMAHIRIVTSNRTPATVLKEVLRMLKKYADH